MNSEERFELICDELGISPSSPEASAAEDGYNIAIRHALEMLEKCASVSDTKVDLFLMLQTEMDQMEIV